LKIVLFFWGLAAACSVYSQETNSTLRTVTFLPSNDTLRFIDYPRFDSTFVIYQDNNRIPYTRLNDTEIIVHPLNRISTINVNYRVIPS